MKLKKRGWLMLVFSFIVVFSLFLICWLGLSSFVSNYADIKRQSYAAVSGQIIREMETSLKNGKTMGSFYAMDTVLKRLIDLCDGEVEAVITDSQGIPLYYTVPEESELLQGVYALAEPTQADLAAIGYAVASYHDYELIIQPIKDENNLDAGSLTILYHQSAIERETRGVTNSIYRMVAWVSAGTVLVMGFFVMVFYARENEKFKRVSQLGPVLVLAVSISIISIFSYKVFQAKYQEVMFEGAERISYYMWEMIHTVHEKGAPYDKLYGLDEFFSQQVSETPMLWNIRMYRTLADTSEILGRYSGFAFIMPFAEDTSLMIEVEISRQFITNRMMEMALLFVITLFISVMIILEILRLPNQIIFKLHESFEKGTDRWYAYIGSILRMGNFLLFLAVYMTTPFSAVLMRGWKQTIFSLPLDVAASFPLTFELLAMMAGSLLLPRHLRKLTLKTTLIGGMGLIIGTNICCFFAGTPLSLILLRFLSGLGMAIHKYFVNAMVAQGSGGGKFTTENVGALNYGALAGITAGASLGSVIAGGFGVHMAYVFTACIVGIYALYMCCMAPWQIIPEGGGKQAVHIGEGAGKDRRELFHYNVVRYVVLVIIPINIVLMFITACLPGFIQNEGIHPLFLSICYLINGFSGIYLGPLFIQLGKKLGNPVLSIAAIPIVGGISIVMLGLPPLMVSTFILSALLGIFDGYGSAVYMNGFLEIPEIKRYADPSVVMTCVGAFASGIQTLSPLIYGSLMAAASYRPMTMLGVGFIVAGILFAMCSDKHKLHKA